MEKFFLRRLNQYEVMTYEAKGAATHRWVDRTRAERKTHPWVLAEFPGLAGQGIWSEREIGVQDSGSGRSLMLADARQAASRACRSS